MMCFSEYVCEVVLQSWIRNLCSLQSAFWKPDKCICQFSYFEMFLISFSRRNPVEVEFCSVERCASLSGLLR